MSNVGKIGKLGKMGKIPYIDQTGNMGKWVS